jgi:two-component system chemotaxis sensor kinase CheA
MDMSRFLDLFLAESREHLGAAHAIRSKLERCPVAPDLWRDFMRRAHSLKGMAASMHFPSIVELTHAVEALAERLEQAPAEECLAYLPVLSESLTCVGNLLDRIERGEDARCAHAEQLARELQGTEPSTAVPPSAAAAVPPSPDPVAPGSARCWRLDLRLDDGVAASTHRTVSILRRIGELGRIVQSGPLVLEPRTRRFRGPLQLVVETDRDRDALERELDALIGREGFALDLAPRPAPAPAADEAPAAWVRVRSDVLDTLVAGLLELRMEQGRLTAALPSATGRVRHHLQRSDFLLKELYGSAMELQLVAFDTVAQRLHQTVLDLARELGKPVRFEIVGGDVRLDRLVLEALMDPLLHSLKNAVDHGIELPHERQAAGKHPQGCVRLSLDRAGERVSLVVADDGHGMHPDVLRHTAIERGMLREDEAAELTDDEALLLATWPRFTTRRDADHISGRGVGLDVVRDRLEGIGGFLEIRSEPGRGCELRMSIPLRRALIRTLLVRCAGEPYAVPLDAVVKSVDLADLPSNPEQHPRLAVVHLSERLGLDRTLSAAPHLARALVLGSAEPRTALVVDEVVGRHDLVVQPLHGPLGRLREYTGAALLEDGSIVLLLEPAALTREAQATPGAGAPTRGSAP